MRFFAYIESRWFKWSTTTAICSFVLAAIGVYAIGFLCPLAWDVPKETLSSQLDSWLILNSCIAIPTGFAVASLVMLISILIAAIYQVLKLFVKPFL